MAVSGDVKLRVYNEALRHLGSRRLSSLTEAREPQRVLTDIWGAADQVVVYALEQGEWNFAIRAVLADYTPSIEPEFGFKRAFQKPDDFVRLAAMASDEWFKNPLSAQDFVDEAGYWFAGHDALFIRYVSSGDEYGLSSGLWTESFKKYLAAYLAYEACERITDSTAKMQNCWRIMEDAKKTAKGNDALNEGTKMPRQGQWLRSRGLATGSRERW